MSEISYKVKESTQINLLDVVLLFIYAISIFNYLGTTVSLVISVSILCTILLLWNNDRFFLVVPLLLFYGQHLILPLGIRVFDVYIILFLIKVLLLRKLKLCSRFVLPLIVILFYSIIVVSSRDTRTAFIIISTIVFITLYLTSFLRDNINLINFMKYYVLALISASTFGLINLSNFSYYYLLDGVAATINRNIGTFTDPNYLGFFVNIAIFAVLSLGNYYSKYLRVFLIAILYIFLITTLSLTALLCNMIGIVLFVIINKSNKFKNILFAAISLFVVLGFWNIAIQYNVPVLSDLISRIQSLGLSTNNSNIDYITSNRTYIWKTHFEYYLNQPVGKILFGGNFITDYGYDYRFKGVSHQSFIDMLLNFGLIGTIILLGGVLKRTIYILNCYFKGKSEALLVLIFIKYIWLFYAFGLSMFPAWVFNLFFFM